MFLLMRYEATEITTDEAVPCHAKPGVELFFDKRRYLLLVVQTCEPFLRTCYSVVLHILRHLRNLNDSSG